MRHINRPMFCFFAPYRLLVSVC